MRNFFRKGNLIALRELALRQTASRVDAQMLDYREDHAIQEVWQVAERILVCIGPNVLAERLVRAGKRLATGLKADWLVAYVETARLARLPAEKRGGILRILRLAEQLGAETATLSAPDMGEAIIRLTRERNINKIVIGKPSRRGWKRWLLGSVVDVLISHAHNINIYLLGSRQHQRQDDVLDIESSFFKKSPLPGLKQRMPPSFQRRYRGYVWAVVVTMLSTLLGHSLFRRLKLANLVMVFLLGVVYIAMRFGRGPSILASILAVAMFDVLFVKPYFSLTVADSQYLITFAVMLVVGILISNLMINVRSQAKVAEHRERRTAALYAISKELAASQTEQEIVAIAVNHLYAEFSSFNVILFPVSDGEKVLGVLALLPVNLRRLFLPEQQKLLETFLRQIAQALMRIRFSEQAKVTQMQIEVERLRNSLLSAISHDLRTPLASIVGSATTLAANENQMSSSDRQELSFAIVEEAERMTNLVNNILDMARLDAGIADFNKQWYPIEEIIGAALNRIHKLLANRPVQVHIPPDIPMMHVDAIMIEQVLVNLLENAARYTPSGSALEIDVEAFDDDIEISLTDHGPGIPKDLEEKMFEKFYQVRRESVQNGVGLGLAICRTIVEVHGGKIRAQNLPEGGAVFTFTLPNEPMPPQLISEE
jgi:two-component system sensor histidine kinase KdpD